MAVRWTWLCLGCFLPTDPGAAAAAAAADGRPRPRGEAAAAGGGAFAAEGLCWAFLGGIVTVWAKGSCCATRLGGRQGCCGRSAEGFATAREGVADVWQMRLNLSEIGGACRKSTNRIVREAASRNAGNGKKCWYERPRSGNRRLQCRVGLSGMWERFNSGGWELLNFAAPGTRRREQQQQLSSRDAPSRQGF